MADAEYLDYLDEEGRHLGVAPRRAVHAEGRWHRVLHLWLATGACDDAALIYQLRGAHVANWPGLLDVSVAGHLLAGETYAEALRESREEIGVDVPAAAVSALGVRRETHPDPAGGVNRELQGIFIAAYDPAWGAFDLVDGEAAGLYRIANADGLRLHRGETDAIEAAAILPGATAGARRRVTVADFVPRGDYYAAMHEAAAALLGGRAPS